MTISLTLTPTSFLNETCFVEHLNRIGVASWMSSMLLNMVKNLISRDFKIPSRLCLGWKDFLCSNSCKSRTLEDCDIQKIYWCFIYITVNFVGVVMTVKTDWWNLITHLLTYSIPAITHVQRRQRALHWRHNDHDDVSNHQPHGCLLNRLFRRRSKKKSKLRVTGLCVGNSPEPVNSPHKGPVTRKMFPFDDVIMVEGSVTQPFGFELSQSHQIHLNSTKVQSFSLDLKFKCAHFSAKVWAFSESEWFSLNVESWR